MKLLQVGIVLLSLTACGTINTVAVDDSTTRQKLQNAKTFCNFIPRFYSGVSYNFCLYHAEFSTDAEFVQVGRGTLVAYDMLFSGLTDTILLPYTIYRQVNDGSIPIK